MASPSKTELNYGIAGGRTAFGAVPPAHLVAGDYSRPLFGST